MRAYIPRVGAKMWKFTEESVVQGKGTFMRNRDPEALFTENVFDPVMLANGCALDPGLYAEGFPEAMARAARKGFYIFHKGGYEMFAVHANDLEVR
jgi:hypothetical protein